MYPSVLADEARVQYQGTIMTLTNCSDHKLSSNQLNQHVLAD